VLAQQFVKAASLYSFAFIIMVHVVVVAAGVQDRKFVL